MNIQETISSFVAIADDVRQGFVTNFYKWLEDSIRDLQAAVQHSFNGYALVAEIEAALAGAGNDQASLLRNIEIRLNEHIFYIDTNDLEKCFPECESIKNVRIHSIAEWNNRTAKTVEEGLERLHKMFDLPRTPTASPEQPQGGRYEAFMLPSELDTAEARQLFQKAIEADLMSKTDSGYKWEKSKNLCAYFADRATEYLKISKALTTKEEQAANWKPFEGIFGYTNLKYSKAKWRQTGQLPKGSDIVDCLFS